eukprot:scaffold114_cov361-Pinguiococcus_pyrenoidosus.AAC.46
MWWLAVGARSPAHPAAARSFDHSGSRGRREDDLRRSRGPLPVVNKRILWWCESLHKVGSSLLPKATDLDASSRQPHARLWGSKPTRSGETVVLEPWDKPGAFSLPRLSSSAMASQTTLRLFGNESRLQKFPREIRSIKAAPMIAADHTKAFVLCCWQPVTRLLHLQGLARPFRKRLRGGAQSVAAKEH